MKEMIGLLLSLFPSPINLFYDAKGGIMLVNLGLSMGLIDRENGKMDRSLRGLVDGGIDERI